MAGAMRGVDDRLSIARTVAWADVRSEWLIMKILSGAHRFDELAAEFNAQVPGDRGLRVATSLTAGLNFLRGQMFTRVHNDVERRFGCDSMLAPLSQSGSEAHVKSEIEVFQVAQGFACLREHQLLSGGAWFGDWLAKLRLAEGWDGSQVRRRLSLYGELDADERRLAFSNILERRLPEARLAPLVVYRLFPLAVDLCIVLALDDFLLANEIRHRQATILPILLDCHECHAKPLENGERCMSCGNPLWKFDWLNASD